MKNYYQILEITPDATDTQIKKQYKTLLRFWQPEKFSEPDQKMQAEGKTRDLIEAYETLTDPIRREAYDQTYKTYIGEENIPEPIEPSKQAVIRELINAARTGNGQESPVPGRISRSIILLAALGVVLLSLLVFIFISRQNPPDFTPPVQSTPSLAVFNAATSTPEASAQQTQAAGQNAAPDTSTTPTVAFVASDPATCQPAAIVPVVSAESEALYPSVSSDEWTLGPESAPITIYEYSDFQCPYCAKAAPELKSLQQAYPRDVRVVFRHFPLSSIHPNAALASQAAEAAGLQKKFWQMHDLLFERQAEWSSLSTEDFQTWLKEKAKSLNLNSNQFMVDLVSEAIVQKVSLAQASALASNINGTPTLLFNKIRYQGRTDLESLTGIIEYFKLPEKSYTACPEMTIDPEKTYIATITTEKGDIVIELYPKQAPWAVNSYVQLVRSNWFDGSSFFRVIPGFVAQAGDPSNSGLGGPGYTFTNEVTPELRFDKAGVVGMANTGNNDNGSQFFITYTAVPDLDGQYTIFGQVIEGLDVLAMLRPRNPSTDQILIAPDTILSISIEEY